MIGCLRLLQRRTVQPQRSAYQPPIVLGAYNQPAEMQSIPFLGMSLNSIAMLTNLLPEHSFRSFPLKSFQKELGLMAASLVVCHLGLLQLWLKARVPMHTWHSGLMRILMTHECLEELAPWMSTALYDLGGVQTQGRHDGHIRHQRASATALSTVQDQGGKGVSSTEMAHATLITGQRCCQVPYGLLR